MSNCINPYIALFLAVAFLASVIANAVYYRILETTKKELSGYKQLIQFQRDKIEHLETVLSLLTRETQSQTASHFLAGTKRLQGIRKQVYILASEAKIKEAIECAMEAFPDSADLIILSSRLTRLLERERREGLTKATEIIRSSIVASLLDTIDDLID